MNNHNIKFKISKMVLFKRRAQTCSLVVHRVECFIQTI